MISDYQRYCGSAFLQMIDSVECAVSIERVFPDRNGYYVLNGSLPVIAKYSTSRKGPWTFNFQQEHQFIYHELVSIYGDCISVFTCGNDGVVALSHSQLRQCLDDRFEEQESISIRRKLKEMYSIRGRDGVLDTRVSKDSFPRLVGKFFVE